MVGFDVIIGWGTSLDKTSEDHPIKQSQGHETNGQEQRIAYKRLCYDNTNMM